MTENTKKYQIEKSKPDTWLNDLDQVVSGWALTVRIFKFNELHTVRVDDLSASVVKPIIEKLISEREVLNDLG